MYRMGEDEARFLLIAAWVNLILVDALILVLVSVFL